MLVGSLAVLAVLNGDIQSDKTILGNPDQAFIPLSDAINLVAQKISDDVHKRCIKAKDYSGCIQSNSPGASDASGTTTGAGENSNLEKC